MTDRRYSEEEVAAIFERATEAQQSARRHLAPGEGMTLADLQEIGRDVGIPSDLVVEAARSLDRAGREAGRSFLGLPIGVGRTIELDRQLTDEEWEHLVVDLRETFDARGLVRTDGSLKQWTNGNLQALLEPTPSGHRLRLRTVNANARALMLVGAALAGFTSVVMIGAAVAGDLTGAIAAVGTIWAVGLGMFGLGAIRLPTWARTRREQMEGVAGRLALASGVKEPEAGSQSPENGNQ